MTDDVAVDPPDALDGLPGAEHVRWYRRGGVYVAAVRTRAEVDEHVDLLDRPFRHVDRARGDTLLGVDWFVDVPPAWFE